MRTSPDSFASGRSICVTSPVITAREFVPRRVRNIFICPIVEFCASSRMTNASFSVRPRMYASGATSTMSMSKERRMRSAPRRSCNASYSGRRYGSTFSWKSPGRKPRLSPASTAGRTSTIRFFSRRLSAETAAATARYVFSRPRGPDPEHDIRTAHRLDVFLLAQSLRLHLLLKMEILLLRCVKL